MKPALQLSVGSRFAVGPIAPEIRVLKATCWRLSTSRLMPIAGERNPRIVLSTISNSISKMYW